MPTCSKPLLLLACLLLSVTAVAAERQNVLFILTEDQGAHLSLLGTPGLQTPHIDDLAERGVYFRNAFVTYPVCSASKASLYTGLHSHTNGILNNTHNYHKPPHQLTAKERNRRLYKTNRVKPQYATLIEILRANGYYQGVTHKLHVAPVEKFPYDEFLHGSQAEISAFMNRAAKRKQPWFLMVNIPNSHRPYPNSDKVKIRVNPQDVELPGYLPDTPLVRQDWAEYLAAIEQTDAVTGQTLDALKRSGQKENTIVIFMSDHGPTFQHGKMTLYDLGLRVPLNVCGPGIGSGRVSDALVSEMDLLPTLLELLDCSFPSEAGAPYSLQGKSISGLLSGDVKAQGHDFLFAEISNKGPLPNDGMQERSVFDGRWKLIYRENVQTLWRQVNADSRLPRPWGNRSYNETIRVKAKFPQQYRILQEMDPQNLGGPVPSLELYDLKTDRDEMKNLANTPQHRVQQRRLLTALKTWVTETHDTSVNPKLPKVQEARAGSRAEFPTAASKKGLQVEIPDDALQLGVKHAVYNLTLSSLVAHTESPSNVSWTHGGKEYQFRQSRLQRMDADIKRLSDSGALVYLVMLVSSGKDVDKTRLLHPDYDSKAPNHLGAFDSVTEDGRAQLAATMEFLAHRWSGSDFSHGRVVGYIMGNEVNSHWWWANRGECTMEEFTDDYVEVMRIASIAVRSQSDWARVYISLEHHWMIRHSPKQPRRSFPARPFLERFAAAARDKGDFEWHMAFHPYPESLFDPKFWEDSTAIQSVDTPRITFRNLEVLTEFMKQPAMLYHGTPRSIILSEQGFHTPKGAAGEELQAAAYCYAYKKIESMDGIDAFILHRHVDHPREGGLRLGLRRYDPSNRTSPPKKRIYDCFRNADRQEWEDTFRFALPIVGLPDWNAATVSPKPPTSDSTATSDKTAP